ncbi:MAG: Na+/H+ antiporter subunit E [Burkholderiales bacterium]
MTAIRRLFPHPLLSLFLLAVWLLLNTTLAVAHILLGLLLAAWLPHVLRQFLPRLLSIRRPLYAVRFGLLVLWDIVVANVRVAILVLGPKSRLRPGWVTVPLELGDAGIASILAGIVTLTPGTVSVELDEQATALRVHVLDLADEQQQIAQIKNRYERGLKEIFAC